MVDEDSKSATCLLCSDFECHFLQVLVHEVNPLHEVALRVLGPGQLDLQVLEVGLVLGTRVLQLDLQHHLLTLQLVHVLLQNTLLNPSLVHRLQQ